MLRWLPNLVEWFSKLEPAKPGQDLKPTRNAGDDPDTTKPLVEHLEDLRRTLIRIAIALFVGFNICLVFANRIFAFLKAPLYGVVPNPDTFLQSFNVTDSFVLAMQLAFYGGLILTMPLLIYFVADFILPALKPKERAAIIPSFVIGAILFVGGAAACYYGMIRRTLETFVKYSAWLGFEPHWTVSSYIGFVTQFMLAVGVTFEVPLVILILVRLGVVRAATVARSRRIMMAVAVVLAAILAPPDPLSMIVMAIPLVVMFEITIWLAKWVESRAPRVRPEARAG